MSYPKIACLTLDMEPDYGAPQGRIRLLENPEYFERYVSILRKHGGKVTMFTVTSLFERYGEHFRQLAGQIPLEYAAHSYSHDPQNADSREEIEASLHALRQFDAQCLPGYRAPIGQITSAGLERLLEAGFVYDASLYPSYRPGKYGYANLYMPNTPFRVTRGAQSLIEFPFTSLSGVRIVFGLSYVKLLGWGFYSRLWKSFGLPDIVLALSHPHDFYFHELTAYHPASLEKWAFSRHARHAFDYYDKMLAELRRQGYEFHFVSEAYHCAQSQPDLLEIPLTAWGNKNRNYLPKRRPSANFTLRVRCRSSTRKN
ncbi:MAG: hypothetical protein Fur0043_22210 [Anaerolineales bacterium]